MSSISIAASSPFGQTAAFKPGLFQSSSRSNTAGVRFGHSHTSTEDSARQPASFSLKLSELKQAWQAFEKKPYPPDYTTSKNPLKLFAEWAIGLYRNSKVKQFLWRYIQPCGYANMSADRWEKLGVKGTAESCSEYTLNQIRQKGFIKGCLIGFARIMSCNPLTMFKFYQKNVMTHMAQTVTKAI